MTGGDGQVDEVVVGAGHDDPLDRGVAVWDRGHHLVTGLDRADRLVRRAVPGGRGPPGPRKNAGLRRANKVLMAAAGFFAVEFDRPHQYRRHLEGVFPDRASYSGTPTIPKVTTYSDLDAFGDLDASALPPRQQQILAMIRDWVVRYGYAPSRRPTPARSSPP